MKQTLSAVMVVLVASTGTLAAGESDAVVAAHRKFFDAYRSCNAGVMATLVADDMQFLHAGGMIEDKQSFVKSVGSCALSDLQSEIMSTRMYGDAAIVTGKLNFKTQQGYAGMLFFTETFVKKNGVWTFVSHQSTEPAKPAGK